MDQLGLIQKKGICTLPEEIVEDIFSYFLPPNSRGQEVLVCLAGLRKIKEGPLKLSDRILATPEIIIWIRKSGLDSKKYHSLLDLSANQGYLETVKFLRGKSGKYPNDQICPWDEETCASAARGGQLEILKFLRGDPENNRLNRKPYQEDEFKTKADVFEEIGICPWSWETCDKAVWNNRLDILIWLRDEEIHGKSVDEFEGICPWDEELILSSAESGNLEIMKYLVDQGFELSDQVFLGAAGSGNLEMIKYLIDQKCPSDEYAAHSAVVEDKLEVLKFFYEKGFPLGDEIYSGASAYSLDCLKFLHEQKYPRPENENLYESAINGENLDCLKFLRSIEILESSPSRSLSWTKELCKLAAIHGKLEILKYLRDKSIHGKSEALFSICPWDKQECLEATWSAEIKAWILEQKE